MSRTGHKPADNKSPVEARFNARFAAIETGVTAQFAAVQGSIDGIGEAYNQVAEGCAEIEGRLEKHDHSLEDLWERQSETRSSLKQVNEIKQKVDSHEFDIKTLINGRLNEHDKAIKDLQSHGSKDVDDVLQSVLLRLQKLEKAPSREKTSQSTTANLSTTALAQALLDRLKNGESIEDEQLAQSLVAQIFNNTPVQPVRHMNTPPSVPAPEPVPEPEAAPAPSYQSQRKVRLPGNPNVKLPGGMPSKALPRKKKPDAQQIAARKHQTEAAREARARKRKRPSSKSGVPAEDDEDDARSAGMKRSRPLASRPEADEDVTIEEGFGEGEHRRRSGRAPKPAQLAAGTVSWAEARVLKKQRLGRA